MTGCVMSRFHVFSRILLFNLFEYNDDHFSDIVLINLVADSLVFPWLYCCRP